jgi:hypothetical protein
MPKVDDILTKALKATKAGNLQWELVGRDSFRAQIGKIFLTISNDDDREFVFAIYDDEGNVLERSSGYFDYTQQHLYEAARRVALKVDDALASLDQQLNDLI